MSDEGSHDSSGRLLHWQKLFDTVLHSDRISAEIGIFVLKVLMTVNGGALITLIAFVTNADSDESSGLMQAAECASKWIFWALLFAMISAAIAYFYQSLVTAKGWKELQEASGVEDPGYKWAPCSAKITSILMVVTALMSFASFVIGGFIFLDGLS